jgi:hypothetical protein
VRHFGNLPIAQQEIHKRVDPGGRIDQAPALDQQAVIFFTIQNAFLSKCRRERPRSCSVGTNQVPVALCIVSGDTSGSARVYTKPFHLAFPSALLSIAMRTATPFRTSSTIADCGQSATSQVSSSPRMIGPGCINIASFLASFSRGMVIW